MSSQLFVAILEHDRSRVERLLSEGADPNAPNENGLRPLHAAIDPEDFACSLEMVKLLIKHGANVNEWDLGHNDTPILRACDPPNMELVHVLLEEGADPNARRSDGESPLRLSAFTQDLELAKVLLRYGSDKTINEYGGLLGLTPLALAALNYDIPMIELLLQNGANPHRVEEFGETARDKLPPREEHDPQEWDRVMELLGRRKP